MAWTNPKTYVVSAVLTAAEMNTYQRDNMLETAPAKVTTAGDIVYATGANQLARLGATANAFLKFNSAGNAVEAKQVHPLAFYPLFSS